MPHYENLQLYLRPGLKLKKIHRVVQFNQSQWLKQHIKLSTEKILEAEKQWGGRWKSVVHINEQCCIRKKQWKNWEIELM